MSRSCLAGSGIKLNSLTAGTVWAQFCIAVLLAPSVVVARRCAPARRTKPKNSRFVQEFLLTSGLGLRLLTQDGVIFAAGQLA